LQEKVKLFEMEFQKSGEKLLEFILIKEENLVALVRQFL